MKENLVKILAIFLLIFLTSCAKNTDKNFKEIIIDNGYGLIRINAEIADDEQEQTKGLMFKEKLNENEGMLFVFENEQEQIFWMKNTLIPLDMVFIDENFEIVDIKTAVPCKEEPCALYKSPKPAKYVLEVNGNLTAKKGIKIGDRIIVNKKY